MDGSKVITEQKREKKVSWSWKVSHTYSQSGGITGVSVFMSVWYILPNLYLYCNFRF